MWVSTSDPGPARRRWVGGAILALILMGSGASAAEIDRNKAAQVMAAYLRHIATLTSWPTSTAADANRPILVGVVGTDPNGVMTPFRDRTESGEEIKAQDRPIRLLDLNIQPDSGDAARERLASCDLLFLSEDADDEWQRIRPLVDGLPIVTVSEMTGFADEGGMIEYFVERRSGKIRMKVNLNVMRGAGLSISARFLGLNAVVVVGGREEA